MRARLRACLLLMLLPAAVLAQEPGMRHRVVMEAMRFEPAQLSLKPGDVVEWVNKDAFPHTATAPGKFDTGEIAPGSSKSLRIVGKGTLEYICALHPTMKAQLILK